MSPRLNLATFGAISVVLPQADCCCWRSCRCEANRTASSSAILGSASRRYPLERGLGCHGRGHGDVRRLGWLGCLCLMFTGRSEGWWMWSCKGRWCLVDPKGVTVLQMSGAALGSMRDGGSMRDNSRRVDVARPVHAD
eukprot:2979595-Rhodomonas_salina.1